MKPRYYSVCTKDGEECLGSDAWFRLDGRNNLSTMIQESRSRLHSMRFVHPNWNGFKIVVGRPSNNREIYKSS